MPFDVQKFFLRRFRRPKQFYFVPTKPISAPEFDQYCAHYEDLLRDPIRDRFTASSLFFHMRKRDLIRGYFRDCGEDSHRLDYLDVGCGKGELLSLLADDFASAKGCDPSGGMLSAGGQAEVRFQSDPGRLPFGDATFDFITAVCVYHHVPPAMRRALTAEIRRVLRPGGTFAIIEHNPWNPATRLIVNRTPVDADAILLPASESRGYLRSAGFAIQRQDYFLYLPEPLYRVAGDWERLLRRFPLGGQYAVFGKPGPNPIAQTPHK